MEWIKKLTKKKYFYLVFFFVLLLLMSFLLHIAIENDKRYNEPHDGMLRTNAKVIDYPDVFTTTEDGESKRMYKDVRVKIELSDSESYECYITGLIDSRDVDDLQPGSTIRVKYYDSNHEEYFFAPDPPERHRTFLYTILIILIVASVVGVIFSSRLLDIMRHRKVMEENLEAVRKQNEMKEKEGMGYNPDGVDTRYDPFSDGKIDYNAKYEENQRLSDAEYSADSTYSGFGGSASETSPESGTYFDPNSTYASSGDQMNTPYGAPNASMDAPFDPNKPYGSP